jgi:N-acetylglucosaminyldiphosphoundecaprenol N-acetyl-beta-D-mannosaminyltransferase
MDVTIHGCEAYQVLDRIFAALDWGIGGWVITANLDILRKMVRDPEVRALANEANLVVADGMPLVWASKLAGERPLARVAGSSLIYPLAAMAARAERSLFFLGGDPGAADKAAEILSGQYPGLRVAGTMCPPYGFEDDPAQIEAIRHRVREARPDIVLVCLGAPKQERLIRVLREDLPQSWFLGLGISFGFVSGQVRRAPPALQRMGLEWLHRMAQEPRRLARRYLVDGLPFAARLGVDAIAQRRRPRPSRRFTTGPEMSPVLTTPPAPEPRFTTEREPAPATTTASEREPMFTGASEPATAMEPDPRFTTARMADATGAPADPPAAAAS